MFKSAFISEYSLPAEDEVSRVIKSHLLSNSEVVIPAGSLRNNNVASLISSNIEVLNSGVLKIAYGNDCKDLPSYADKYPDINWSSYTLDAFEEFGKSNNVAVYDLKNTYERFNAIMKKCARGEVSAALPLFNSQDLNREIISINITNHLHYMEIMEKHISDVNQVEKFTAYMKYIYNLCGALSTDSGNTFSIENSASYDYFQKSSNQIDANSGLSLILSCALDVTDGIEDFSFLDDLENSDLDKLSFSDVLEIRQHWLHDKIIETYEALVEECVLAISASSLNDYQKSIIHIEKAFQIKLYLNDFIKQEVKKEVNAYKIHRLCKFLADSSISMVEKFSGISAAKSLGRFIYSATTEVAVLANKETHFKNLIEKKTNKLRSAALKGEAILGAKSPTLEYLRLVADRLEN